MAHFKIVMTARVGSGTREGQIPEMEAPRLLGAEIVEVAATPEEEFISVASERTARPGRLR